MKQNNKGFLKAAFMTAALLAILPVLSAAFLGCDMGGGETQAAMPTASPGSGSVSSGTEITLSTATAGAVIYYTTDGNTPFRTSTRYSSTSKPKITAPTTIKAIAMKGDLADSEVLTTTYTISSDEGETEAAMPTASPRAGPVGSGQEITLSTTTEEAVIYYTIDESEPSRDSTSYSDASKPKITAPTTIKAIAVKEGMVDSAILTATYTIDPGIIVAAFNGLTADGSANAATSGKLTLTFDKDIVGLAAADIIFDGGTTGARAGTLSKAAETGVYELALSGITQGGAVSISVSKTGYTISNFSKTVTVYYHNSGGETQATMPTASPGAGPVTFGTEITLSTTTAGADIYYTTDESEPSRDSIPYSAATKPKIIVTNTTIKAIAVKEGITDSEVLSALYSIAAVTSVTLNPLTATVVRGTTQPFTAKVDGTNNPATTVRWSIVETGKHMGTTINSDGLLIIAAAEPLDTLTIMANSTMDDSKSGAATVTVTSVTVPIATPGNLFKFLQAALDETSDSTPELISIESSQSFTITIASTADLEGVTWYWVVDGERRTDAAKVLVLNFTSPSVHHVTLFIEKGGVIASKEFTFRVTN